MISNWPYAKGVGRPNEYEIPNDPDMEHPQAVMLMLCTECEGKYLSFGSWFCSVGCKKIWASRRDLG